MEFTSIHLSPLSIKQCSFWKLLLFLSIGFLQLVIRLLYLVISGQVSYLEKKSFLYFIGHFYKKNYTLSSYITFF